MVKDSCQDSLEYILNADFRHELIKSIHGDEQVMLYGYTDLGRFVKQHLQMNNKNVCVMYDEFISTLEGKPEEAVVHEIGCEYDVELDEVVVLICHIDIPFSKLENHLQNLGFIKIIHCYEYLLAFFPELNINNGWIVDNLSDRLIEKIKLSYNIWCDIKSRKGYLSALYWRVGRCDILYRDIMPIYGEMFPMFVKTLLTHHETFVDCGAYCGNTIWKFLQCVEGKFDKIVAYEPNEDNFRILINKCNTFMNEEQIRKVYLYRCGLYNGIRNCGKLLYQGGASKIVFDDFSDTILEYIDKLSLTSLSLIKIHTEGNELQVLQGAIKSIKKYRPIIIVTLYHTLNDFFNIPIYLTDNLRNYRFYHRIYRYCGQSEIMYAIPIERIFINDNSKRPRSIHDE